MNAAIRFLFMLPLATIAFPASAADPVPPKGLKKQLGSTLFRDAGSWVNAALSPDGKYLVQQGPRGTQKVDLATGAAEAAPGEKSGNFGRQLRFAETGGRALSVNYSDVVVWDASSGKPLATVKRALPFGENAASLSKDGRRLAIGGNQNFNAKDKPITAVVWDVDKNEKVVEVAVIQNQDVQVALSPDGTRLATWGRHFDRNPPKEPVDPANDPNRLIQIWDVSSGKELSRTQSDGYQPAIVFAPDGDTCAISSGAGLIRLLDPKTAVERRRLFGRADQGTRVVYSPGGKRIATAGGDGTIQIWDAATGERVGSHEFPLGAASIAVRGIVFTSDDRAVAWASAGFTALAWDVQKGTMLAQVEGHVSGVRSIAFAEKDGAIVTGGDDGQVIRWKPDGTIIDYVRLRNPGSSSALNRYPMVQVHLTADGRKAISQLLQQGVFEIPGGVQLSAPQFGLRSDVRSFLCSDAKTFLSLPFLSYPPAPLPAAIKITAWDIENGTRISEFESPPCELNQAALTPDGSTLITVTVTRDDKKSEQQITAWELKTGKKLGQYREAGGFGPAYLAAGDNKTAIASTPGGKVVALNLADGKALREIDTGRRNITCHPAFTKDGATFAVAVSTGVGPNTTEILLYDAATGMPKGKFRGHTAAVRCLAFSADGLTLASGSEDTTAILWDVNQIEK